MTDSFSNLLDEAQRTIEKHKTEKPYGARTRSGEPCKARGRGAGGRCKMHGGQSTGPRTAEGRKRCREAVLRRWKKSRSK